MSGWSSPDQATAVFGDSGPWVESLPTLWRAVSWPAGPRASVAPAWRGLDPARAPAALGIDSLAKRIRYWTPLLHLTWGALGWVDPALGAVRWVQAGMPTADPALKVMKRWWGENVQSLWQWADETPSLQHASEQVSLATGTQFIDRHNDVARIAPPWEEHPEFTLMRRRDIFDGGTDGLHLGFHVLGSLLSEGENAHPTPSDTQIMVSDGRPKAVLVLPTYAGWYRTLHKIGATLPSRLDGRNWRVTVLVEPLGCLGEYRRSSVTGRWFSGSHRYHILGSEVGQ